MRKYPHSSRLFSSFRSLASCVSLTQRLQQLYNSIRDFRDSHYRLLSQPFQHLPNRAVSQPFPNTPTSSHNSFASNILSSLCCLGLSGLLRGYPQACGHGEDTAEDHDSAVFEFGGDGCRLRADVRECLQVQRPRISHLQGLPPPHAPSILSIKPHTKLHHKREHCKCVFIFRTRSSS